MHELNDKVFDDFPILESDRLLYRSFEKSDAPAFFKIRSNMDVMKYMDSYIHQKLEDAEEYIAGDQRAFENKTMLNWAIIEKLSGQLIGYFGFWRLDRKNCRGEVGYALLPEVQRKGYMREAMSKLIPFSFDKLNLHTIEANVNPENEASMQLLEQFGFKKEAYFRENYLYKNRFIDSVIYCLVDGDLLERK